MAEVPGGRGAPPDFAEARALAGSGHLSAAAARYRACIKGNPGFLPAYVELAGLLLRDNEADARRLLGRALGLAHGAPAPRLAIAGMLAALLGSRPGENQDPDTREQLLACLDVPGLDAQPLARPTAALLLHDHPRPDPFAAARDPLWLAFLARCRNIVPAMEARLIALRDAILDDPDPALGPLAAGLALQAWMGGYVLPKSPYPGAGRNPESQALPTTTPGSRLRGSTISAALRRAMVARPTPEDGAILTGTSSLATVLVQRALAEPAEERRLAKAIPRLDGATRPASAQVRAQYEEHPYPRWQAPPPPRRAGFRDHLAHLPEIDAAALPPAPLRTLVAGCGTGYEAIDLARTDPTLTITALDLSRASLGYAARMARSLRLDRIAFVQGDLLDLRPEQNRFDLIMATGVLHHLADPLAGLRTLAAVLAPGGVIRVALYTRRARTLVCAARALIAERGWHGDDGIRALRAHVLALPSGDPLARIVESDDFWSLAGCRDLLFHELEHQFHPAEIAALITSAGLTPVGVDTPVDTERLFADRFGTASGIDLEKWDVLEADHPAIFAGMLHCWCQRPISP